MPLMINSLAMISLLCMLFCFSSLWITSHVAAAVFIGDTLRPGEALNSSSFMVSPSREFTLGFHSGYLTVRSISNYTLWVAEMFSPISDPSTALLTLDKNKTVLQITQSGMQAVVLYSSPFISTNVVATLTDSGNLVLQELDQEVSNNSPKQMRVLWQSNDGHNVALRPEMKLGNDSSLVTQTLWSWRQQSQNSRGSGSFNSFYLSYESRQLEIRRGSTVWWSSGEFSAGRFEFINIPDESKVKYNFNVVSNDNEDSFSYSYTAVGDQNVTPAWVLDTDGELYDVIYNISIARAGDCDGYNTNGGCKRWAQDYGCYVFLASDLLESASNGSYEAIKHGSFERISKDTSHNSTWLDSDGGVYGSDCKATCWGNCECLGFDFVFDNQTGCRYWSVEYSHFLEDPNSSTTGFILPNPPGGRKPYHRRIHHRPNDESHRWIWIGIAIVAVLLALVLCSMCYLIRRRKLAGENQRKIQDMLNMMNSNRPSDANGPQNDGKRGHDLSVFKYASVITATCNFSDENKLGEGGFGPVYKGKLVTGQEVAVKRLSKRSGQGISEFKNELILIYELQHTNLVQLFGFCIHGEERMLIYEYLPNKSLDYFLFDSTRCKQLDWNVRFNIIEGIAQGLLYLHKYSRTRIIHRDLKASNVLLDERMNPKISDFGMARIFAEDEQEAHTMKIVGTRGYMSPEYVMGGNFSIKSDVYSFGVLMLEILSGRKNNSFYNDDRALNLVGYAWRLWKEGAGLELMDPILGHVCDKGQLLRCINVGLLCVEENAASRPTMLEVISMLGNESTSLPVPTKPAFCTERNVLTPVAGGNGPEMVASVNGISNSDLDGR